MTDYAHSLYLLDKAAHLAAMRAELAADHPETADRDGDDS